LVCTYANDRATLYQDGKQVATVTGTADRTPWQGPLLLGQYTVQGPQYQLQGQLAGVNIYRRAIKPEEVAENFKAGPPR
jgi:hypothetical protein